MPADRVAWSVRAREDGEFCGDQVGSWITKGGVTLCVVDGLGHGKKAEAPAKAAIANVARHLEMELEALFKVCDRELSSMRGAVMAVAQVDEVRGQLTYLAIGNISARVWGTKERNLASAPGIVGAGHRRIWVESFTLQPGDLLLLHTDGLKQGFPLHPYVAGGAVDLQKLVGAVMEGERQGNDDAGILVYRFKPRDPGGSP